MLEAKERNPRIIIVGAGGRLGAALSREYRAQHPVIGFTRAQLDLAAPDEMRSTLGAVDFDLLINCAAQTNVDRCEEKPEEAFALNAAAPGVLAEICHTKKARLIHISTDYVFDGASSTPYTEEDAAKPISVYGESKRAGEQQVLAVAPRHLVVRVSWVFGPDRPSFVDWVIGQAREHEGVSAIADKISTPTYTLDLAEMLRPLFADTVVGGTLHLANGGECSWRDYGQHALDCCARQGIALRARTVEATQLREMKSFVAHRPIYSVLSTTKYERLTGQQPRDWREAVADYVCDYVKT